MKSRILANATLILAILASLISWLMLIIMPELLASAIALGIIVPILMVILHYMFK